MSTTASLRPDAPSFVPLIGSTPHNNDDVRITRTTTCSVRSSAPSSSSSSTVVIRDKKKQKPERKDSGRNRRQQQHHQLLQYHHAENTPKTCSSSNNASTNNNRSRRRRTSERNQQQHQAPQQQQQQQQSSSLSSSLQEAVKADKDDACQQPGVTKVGSQRPKQQQPPNQRRRRSRKKGKDKRFVNHQQLVDECTNIIFKTEANGSVDDCQQQQQQTPTTNIWCMMQKSQEEAFPVLANTITTSSLWKKTEKDQVHHHYNGDSNDLVPSSYSAAHVWKSASSVLDWTTTTTTREVANDDNATATTSTTCAAINSRLTNRHHHHSLSLALLENKNGSLVSSSELLTILPRRQRQPQQQASSPTRRLENVSSCNPKTVETRQGGEATTPIRNDDNDEETPQLREEQRHAHHHHHHLKNWDMEKLRNRWWQLVREHRPPASSVVATPAPSNDHCGDSSSSSSESFEDVYFGKGAQQQHHQQQKQHQQNANHEIDDAYYTSSLPLHEAIRRNDEACLRAILKSNAFSNKINNNESLSSSVSLSPLQLAVQLDRPRLVRILFAQSTYNDKNSDVSTSENHQGKNGLQNKPAILIAAELGHDECLQAFLSASHGPSILLTRDLDSGNTVLHYCCLTENATASMLRHCLRVAAGSYNHNNGIMSSSSSSSSSLLAKLLLYKNSQGQTCMHIACEKGRVDLVEVMLSNTNGMTLLSKVLSVQDDQQQTPLLAAVASGCTDVVMALLMWRGNNVFSSANKGGGGMPVPSSSLSQCPLARAVQSRNVDMVSLLLEFNDPSAGKRGYNLTRALHEAVHMVKTPRQTTATARSAQRDHDGKAKPNNADTDDELLDIIRILVNAGANPCCSTYLLDSVDSNHVASTSSSAVGIAAELVAPEVLTVLLKSYQAHLYEIRNARRRDPVLQKQPESFFAALESRENAERTSSMRDALTNSLFHGWRSRSSSHTSSCNGGDVFFECSLALYRGGAVLGSPGLERLKQTCAAAGRNAKELKPMTNVNIPSSLENTLYEVKYSHLLGGGASKGHNKKPSSRDKPVVIDNNTEGHQFWSRMMQKSPWKVLSQDCVCDWIPLVEGSAERDLIRYPQGDIRLVCNDGQEFVVHSTIVTKKSAKLAAAIHFERMKSSIALNDYDVDHVLDDDDDMPEIDMSACCGRVCRWLLQHIYHGSIADGLPNQDSVECCHALLELMLVAGEYLCWSLVQECEMRLLAANSCSCHCCLCSRAATHMPCSSNDDEIECEYYSVGPSMCITPHTVLDVLAVCQYMGQSLDDTSYTLRKSAESTLPSWLVGLSSNKWTVTKPLEALREAALGTILMHFQAVMQSEEFLSQFVLNEAHDKRADVDQLTEVQRGGLVLLQNTMDEFVDLVVASIK